MNDLEIVEEKIREGVKFIAKGRINATNAEDLLFMMREALDNGSQNIVLNMLKVDFLSSAGIKAILRIYKDTAEAGGKFGIEMPSQNVRNVLGMIALDEMLI